MLHCKSSYLCIFTVLQTPSCNGKRPFCQEPFKVATAFLVAFCLLLLVVLVATNVQSGYLLFLKNMTVYSCFCDFWTTSPLHNLLEEYVFFIILLIDHQMKLMQRLMHHMSQMFSYLCLPGNPWCFIDISLSLTSICFPSFCDR